MDYLNRVQCPISVMAVKFDCLLLGVLCLLSGSVGSKRLPEGVEDSPLTYISALKGSKVSLTCEVTPPTPRDRPILVLFYKGNTGTPIYSIDAREGEFDHGSQWIDDAVIGSRAYFDTGTVPPGLVIDPVGLRDAALYRCRVDFRSSPTRNARIALEVTEPPKRLKILNEIGSSVEGSIGPFAAASKVVLRCEVTGGHPRPSVLWFRNGAKVDDVSETKSEEITSNMLTLSNLSRNDLSAALTCRASNSNISSPLTSSVTVEMIFKPEELTLVGGEDPQREGTVTNFMCESKGSRPPAEISWWKESERLQNFVSKTYNNGNVTRSTIGVPIKMEDHKSRVVCRAENPVIPSAVLEVSRILNVLYSPRPTLAPGMNLDLEGIKEGDDIFFECKINSNPPTSNVEWYFNQDERLVQNLTMGIIESNQSLVLQKVGKESTGMYNCVAHNSFGRGTSNTLELRVKFSPVCVSRTPKIFGAEKNERMTVSCDVLADPSPKTFEWAFNTSSEVVDMTWFKGHIGKEVSYTPRSDLDFGSLLCWANNEVGTQKVPCVIHVIHAGIPSPVRNCSAINVTTCCAFVECLPGWNGGLEQSFTIEVLQEESSGDPSSGGKTKNEESNNKIQTRAGSPSVGGKLTDSAAPLVLANTATSPHPVFVVEGLKEGRRYLVSVRAVNAKGQSDETILRVVTTEEEHQKRVAEVSEIEIRPGGSRQMKVTPLIATAAGVFGSFSLACLLLGVFFWRRRFFLSRSRKNPQFSPEGKRSPSTTEDFEILGSKMSPSDPDVLPANTAETVVIQPHRSQSEGSREIGKKGPYPETSKYSTVVPAMINNRMGDGGFDVSQIPPPLESCSFGPSAKDISDGVDVQCLPPPPSSFSYSPSAGGSTSLHYSQAVHGTPSSAGAEVGFFPLYCSPPPPPPPLCPKHDRQFLLDEGPAEAKERAGQPCSPRESTL